MGFFDTLKDRATDLAQAGVAQSKRLAEIAKLKTANMGEEDTIKKAYIELGKAYYEEHHNDAEGLYAQLVEEVDAVNARIEEMQSEIDSLKGSFHAGDDAGFEDVVAQDEGDGGDISVEITVEEEPETPAAETTEEHTGE